MSKKLNVIEFQKKQRLLDYVNSKTARVEVVSITSSREGFFYKHFLWFYEKWSRFKSGKRLDKYSNLEI